MHKIGSDLLKILPQARDRIQIAQMPNIQAFDRDTQRSQVLRLRVAVLGLHGTDIRLKMSAAEILQHGHHQPLCPTHAQAVDEISNPIRFCGSGVFAQVDPLSFRRPLK